MFESVARYFALLSDPTRLRIVHAICRDEKPVARIVADASASQTNVSRHLGLLYRAGVLARRRAGAQVWYRVSDTVFTEICRAACTRVAADFEGDRHLRQHARALIADLGEPGARKAVRAASGGEHSSRPGDAITRLDEPPGATDEADHAA